MATIKQTELLAREEPRGRTAMHWIGGQWLDSGEHRESINPATGEVIGNAGGPFNNAVENPHVSGRDPQGRSYFSFASFEDPDGNGSVCLIQQ